MNNFALKRAFEGRYDTFWKFSILNILTRGISILGGLFLNFYLARSFSLEEYGTYGIIYSSIIIGVYLIGLDIYVVTTRELPKFTDSYNQKKIVYHQTLLYLISYAIILPIYLKFLWSNFIEAHLIFFFIFLLLLEHFTQEFIRIYFALRYAVISNIIIFCRRILWISLFLFAVYFNRDLLSFKVLLTFWIIGDAVAILGGVYYGFKINLFPFLWDKPDFELIKKIIKGSFVFLVASISLKVLSYSGNYFIKYYYTSKQVGVFSFFLNILNFVDILIYTSLVALFLPRMIELRHKNEERYEVMFKKFSLGVIVLVGIAFAILIIFIKPFLLLIGKPDFWDNLKIFYILAIGFISFGISNIPHYFLYINESEQFILYSSLIACASNIFLNFLFIQKYGMLGCAMAFLLSMIVLLATKTIFSCLFFKKIKNISH